MLTMLMLMLLMLTLLMLMMMLLLMLTLLMLLLPVAHKTVFVAVSVQGFVALSASLLFSIHLLCIRATAQRSKKRNRYYSRRCRRRSLLVQRPWQQRWSYTVR